MTYKTLYTLVERESYWLRQRIESLKGRRVAVFPAGLTAQAFYHTLLNDYGIEADYFIDNNPDLTGTYICDKQVILRPWEDNPNFADEYFILIPTLAEFYFQIAEQMENVNILSYMHADSFSACQLWDRYKNVLNLLDDEKSKISYLGAIYSMLTHNNSFIQCERNPYFSIRQFVYNGFDTVVDAGAYTGDTVEEYIKHGFGSEKIKIYAFEPYGSALSKLEARIKRLKDEWFITDTDIIIVPAGVGSETKQIRYANANANMLKQSEQGDFELMIYSLDDYFKDKKSFTILKADIEGGEMDMLKGAKKTIQRHKPKITICIYHSPQDFARIAEYIKDLVPEYNFAIRNHFYDHRETILYCWV